MNVFGEKLESCSVSPLTGFYRDGCCNTGPEDIGAHIVCAQMTDQFLEFSKEKGNDLSTPNPPYFPGLVSGDRWCLCVSRWVEAYEAGMAPKVYLESTHIETLEWVDLKTLQEFAAEPETQPPAQ